MRARQINVSLNRRGFSTRLAVASLLLPALPSCKAKPMSIVLDVSMFSYIERPIFDVLLNGKDIGGSLGYRFYGSNSVIVDMAIPLGPQVVTWRLDGPKGTPGNGDLVKAKNTPMLTDVPKGTKWLAVHIYDDNTVELALSRGSPDELSTQRGMKIIETWERAHGKR